MGAGNKKRKNILKNMYPGHSLSDYKRLIFIDELHKLNVTKSRSGEDLESLDYATIKAELSVAQLAEGR
ncbi:hypothetical protein JMM81_12505 [Bacillus sp. V3B]|uniref:hypothetical protein n=1 Tax=Bacillus sp. V3B TaxID=2804915 RepID=UPI00210B4A22|nr:hypothetical protein [Bacillus sp. V3B]MCQ6275777.1 hypothetical protein [Bacillus sp. V3B]